MTKLSPGQEYLTPFHRCEWRRGKGRGGGGDQRRSELGLVMHIQNGARSVARALPFAPSARAYVFVSGPASDGRMSLSYLISPYLIFEQTVIIRCKDGLASDGSISGEGGGMGGEERRPSRRSRSSRAIRMWKFNSEKAVKRYYHA